MLASAHITAGAVAGLVAMQSTSDRGRRVAIALGLGFLSHVLLDMVPHGDYAPLSQEVTVRVALLEAFAMCLVVWFTLRRRLPPGVPDYLLAGVGAAALPDFKSVAALFLPPDAAALVREYGYALHDLFHAPPPSTLIAGWGAEIACTVVLLAVLIVMPRRATAERQRMRFGRASDADALGSITGEHVLGPASATPPSRP